MIATRIIAVRHGETAWNVENRIQGQLDIELNETGHWQARQLARALRDEPIDAIYSSDLVRAHATAMAAAAGFAGPVAREIVACPGLRERAFGVFEGQTFTDIETQWPLECRRWRQRDPHFAPEGGETPLQVLERVRLTVRTIAQEHPKQQILLVTHGGVLDMLYRIATHQEVTAPRTWELGNAAINRLLWTPETLSLVGWADTRHLEALARDEISP
jgi:probable phosphoglycerate mutase